MDERQHQRLSVELRRDIDALGTQVFVSVASLWELAIKSGLKRIAFPANPGTYVQRQLERQRFRLLDIKVPHIDVLTSLPQNHRDPFDRMIIAQGRSKF